MKKVLLTIAILFAGTLGFYSCTEDIDPAEPNAGTQTPDDQKEPEKEPEKEEEGISITPGTEVGSASPFPAGYFDEGNIKSGIRVGAGFLINDPTTTKIDCFTKESRDISKCIRQNRDFETDFQVFYTENDYEYKTLTSTNYSGSVGFLNIINVGGTKLTEMTNCVSSKTERLIFVASVDFGNYFYEEDLKLTPEAYKLIKEGKFENFTNTYGSHFIYGFGKTSSITVELTKNVDQQDNKEAINQGIDVSLKYKGITPDFHCKNTQEVGNSFKKLGYTVRIKKNGSELDSETLKEAIQKLKNTDQDLVEATNKLLESELKSLYSEEDASISRYYPVSFNLYGCEGIKWDKKKEGKLTSINQNYLDILRFINLVKEYTKENTIDIISKDYIAISSDDIEELENQPEISESAKTKIKEYYNIGSLENEWIALKSKAQTIKANLEKQYTVCSEIAFDIKSDAGQTDYSIEIEDLFDQYDIQISKANKAYQNIWKTIWKESDRIHNENEQRLATINIHNKSNDPYKVEFYKNGMYYNEYTIDGSTMQLKVEAGSYKIKAIQKSGYWLYATINNRIVEAEEQGNYDIYIGYED